MLLLPAVAYGGMQALDDSEMSSVSGQAGLVIESEARASIDSLRYGANGHGLHFDGIELGAASEAERPMSQRHDISLRDSGAMNVDFRLRDWRLQVDDIRLSDRPDQSMGALYLDQNAASGFLTVSPGGAVTAEGFEFDLFYNLMEGRFGYRTNDNQVILDDMGVGLIALGMSLDMQDGVAVLRMPQVFSELRVGGIRYGQSEENFRGSLHDLPSMGNLRFNLNFGGRMAFQAGGRFGNEGLRIDSETMINTGRFLYGTNGHDIIMRLRSGESHLRDLRMDVAPDPQGRLGLAFTLDEAEGEMDFASITFGDSGSMGELNLQWLFADTNFHGEGFTNQVFLQGGGHPATGPQGLRLASQWSLQEGQIGYTTNGNPVYITGIQSWGKGDLTVDVTREGTLEGVDFYDGLRLGFDGLSGGVRSDGLRVGDEEAPRQAGLELLGLHPHYEFGNLDGHITFGPPGHEEGDEGLAGMTINADLVIRDAISGALINDQGQGLWAADQSHDIILRDMTLQVTEEGLELVMDEGRQTLDIGNLRLGTREEGESFGRLVFQSYETGSEITIGGMGDGSEGLRIRRQRILAPEVDEDRRNRFVWETGRERSDGVPVNDTGMKLVLENIHTSDGADLNGDGEISNTFGLQSDTRIDVRPDPRRDDGALGLGIENRTRFRELNVGSVDLVHPTGGATTALHGISLQNMDVRSDLVATPIR
ncbi:MAG: hypothetical protein R3296_14710 [Oleiphilaceae bacterium]|nr:hypothetical protein [Oleiphilaceae bacterium]